MVVTGVGLVSPHGMDPSGVVDAILNGESAIRLTPSGREPVRVDIPMARADWTPAEHISRLEMVVMDPVAQMGLTAARGALVDSGMIDPDEPGDARSPDLEEAGVYFGCGLGGLSTYEESLGRYFDMSRTARRAKPTIVPRVMPNAPAAHISMTFGLRGPSNTYSVACTSSGIAVGEAFRAIRDGYLDCAVAGGAEAMLTDATMIAWEAMGVLATEHSNGAAASCRPFDIARTGMVLGEGAAALVLETEERARARGARILGEIVGFGSSSDAHNLTQPSVDGQIQAMKSALSDAKLSPDSVGYVNAHATGTSVGDMVEVEAIQQFFGAHTQKLAVSSTKSMHGHLVGAAGALELVITLLALQREMVPPTANLDDPDPKCALNLVPGTGQSAPGVHTALSNSFGFGGANACLVVRRVTD